MKKAGKKILTLVAALVLTLVMCMPAFAASNEDTQNAVMKVMWGYVAEDGTIYPIKYGTCFLINESTVLTNMHVLDFTDDEQEQEAIAYLNHAAGLDLTELSINNNHLQIFVFPNRDTKVPCTIDTSAQSDIDHLDFVVLRLNKPLYGRNPVVLGDSDSVQITDSVFAYGFPEDSIVNKKENTSDDVSVVSGTVSKVTTMPYADVFEHSAALSEGNSGGPLTNAEYEVIGMNEFIKGVKNYSVQINAIKSVLDTYGIEYTSSGPGPHPGIDNPPVSKTALNTAITKGSGYAPDEYTEDSYKALQAAVEGAKTVTAKEDAAQDEVDAAEKAINDAIAALVKVETPQEPAKGAGVDPLMIGLAAAIIAAIAVIAGIVISGRNKNKERSAYGGIGGSTDSDSYSETMVSGQMTGSTSRTGNTTVPIDEGRGGTVILEQGEEGTTLLNATADTGAYLIRKKTGEKIVLSNSNFVIGKQKSDVDYCITDNSAISRRHAIIRKKGDDFYLVDQKSTNCSYVNGAKAYPDKEVALSDAAVLKFANEEFEFHKA
jgi:V8-like Glu-specific endopeptidase